MVITCPNCEAKYKLPGEKLKGRGAKITCPRCAHVFVIFNQEAESAPSEPALEVEAPPAEEDEPSASRQAAPPGPPPSSPSVPGAGPLPGGLKAEDIFTSDYGGVEFDVEQSRQSLSDAGTKAESVEPPSGSERVRQSMAGELVAENLDFKAVGVEKWKVKVAIGLIYDFADIKTLRKSMREKKVTQDDQISHDGKDWHRIGSDAEQEEYFAEIHAQLMEETGGKVEEKPKRPTPSPSAAPDATTSASIEPSATTSTAGAAHGDAFRVELKQRPQRASQRRRARQTEDRKLLGMNPTLLSVGVAAIFIIGLIVTLSNSRSLFGRNTEDQPTSRITDEQLERIAAKEAERIQAELDERQAEILAEQEDKTASEEYEEPTEDGYPHRRNPDGTFDDTGLEPVMPDIEPSTPAPVVDREEPREQPTEASNDTSDREAATDASDSAAQADSTVQETTAEDWFMLGEMALGSGNCGNAIPHLQKAVSMAAGRANYHYKLGLALHQCGRDAEAISPLKSAAGAVPAAQELLNQIEGGGSE